MLTILENFLASHYIHGEKTFEVEEDGKRKTVKVERTEFNLTEKAISAFKVIHDEWELEVCKKNPHDALLGGNSATNSVTLALINRAEGLYGRI